METKSISGLTLYFNPEDEDAADLIGDACGRTVSLIEELWGIAAPDDCRVYVMTSWMRFALHAAPWRWRVLLGATLPLWGMQVRKVWPYAGGWVQKFGQRRAVGIKPPRLVQLGDSSLGEQIFTPVEDVNDKVQHVTCHELTHGFTSHLKLPSWLYEGLAMVTVDRFAAAATVKSDTIDALTDESREKQPEPDGRIRGADREAFLYHYVRGYWITRYVSETQQDLLRSLLHEPQKREELENRLAAGLGMSQEAFWADIDEIAATHFAGDNGVS